jgi:hypothetical protein
MSALDAGQIRLYRFLVHTLSERMMARAISVIRSCIHVHPDAEKPSNWTITGAVTP